MNYNDIVVQFTSAVGTVCLSYLVSTITILFLVFREPGSCIVAEGFKQFISRYPHYFLIFSLPIMILNQFISPVILIVCSFVFAFVFPRTVMDAMFE